MELHSLSCREKLDGNDVLEVVEHVVEPPRPVGRHAHMVLLIRGGGNTVHAGRMGEALVLGGERRRGDSGHHETAVQSAVVDQEGGEAAEVRVHEQRGAPFGERSDFGDGQSQHVGGEGDGFGVEVASGEHLTRIGKDQGVVGHRVRLGFEERRGLAEQVETGAHHLGLAADGVGVLDPVTSEMRGADLAALHQRAQHGGDGNLSTVAPHFLDTAVEGDVAALDRIGGHRTGYQGGGQDVLDPKGGGERQGGRDLGPVQERKPLLRREPHRLHPGPSESFPAGQELPTGQELLADPRLPFPDQDPGQMRERCEISRRAGGALRRNPRIDAVLEERSESLDDLDADTRVAAGERHQLRQDHEAYDPVAEILAHPRRVRANDVLLELREFVVADADMGEMPAAGVDPIDGPASLDRVFDRVRGGGDPPTRPAAEDDGHLVQPGFAQDFERDWRLADLYPHSLPPDSLMPGTMGRLSRCSRAQAMASS